MKLSTFCLPLLLTTATQLVPVLAFSARLSRPWEVPSSTNNNRNRWNVSSMRSTSVPAAQQDQDPREAKSSSGETGASSNEDMEETMSLQQDDDADEENTTDSLVSKAPLSKSQTTEQPTVRSSLKLLWGMCRPTNFLGVVLFHILGTHLALQSSKVGTAQLLPILTKPSMFVVLLSLLLTSSTSMVVNDYFDNQLGVDAHKVNKPLVKGTVTMAVAKRFLYYLYAALLLCLTCVPGVPARLSVVTGVMLTYWYTRHLKPITWLKNVVCASLIALSPATSGAAAIHLANPNTTSLRVFIVPALTRLIGVLFCGFVGREILMDINDVSDDRTHKVRTVPVVHGRKYASKAALICTAIMAAGAWAGPIWQLVQALRDTSWSMIRSSLLTAGPARQGLRRLLLASIGCGAMLRRAWQVYKTEGEDRDVVERAIEEGKTTIMFILASFV